MATRAVTEASLIINGKYDLVSQRRGGFYTRECAVKATVTSPLLNEKVTVLYNDKSYFTDSGFRDSSSIKVTLPIRWEFAATGLGAESRCTEALCQKIEEFYLQNQLSNNSGHSV